ncbi:hypothetical protein FHL15_008866 [Xylaria flabelliformis]|uniref:Uncharacterized protein n=1 Tax=Xylaria flabelliformis TaxID=2512241 RepID=A0A553HQU7_9PEZI|nr:hypothetical protein FHL15_008866 [Xylaria flabelliformis]
MPVVSLPVQQTHKIISPSINHLDQAQFLLTAAAALVGPIALLALVVSLGKKYKTSIRPILVEVRAMTTTGDWACSPTQSREPPKGTITMSVSRKSGNLPLEAPDVLAEDDPCGRRDLSQSPRSRHERTEESGTLEADADDSQNIKARPPPPMPLTPSAPSTTFFSFQDRRLSVSASTNGDYDPTLTQGGNSDINSAESTTIVPNVRASSPISMRRSYTKIFPLDPLQPTSSKETEMEHASSAFAPSSFPSSSPILPLAPHAALESKEIDVSGEIVSVMDDSGAGWKRHTRVYGGGVCLACLASGGNHGGGFYGENVPLDQRR